MLTIVGYLAFEVSLVPFTEAKELDVLFCVSEVSD